MCVCVYTTTTTVTSTTHAQKSTAAASARHAPTNLQPMTSSKPATLRNTLQQPTDSSANTHHETKPMSAPQKEPYLVPAMGLPIRSNAYALTSHKRPSSASAAVLRPSSSGHLQAHALHYTATRCNTLQHTSTHCNILQHTATHFNTLQHTATHCNTLQHTATHFNTLQHTATHCNTLQTDEAPTSELCQCRPAASFKLRTYAGVRTTLHCNTLQHSITHCNTLQR